MPTTRLFQVPFAQALSVGADGLEFGGSGKGFQGTKKKAGSPEKKGSVTIKLWYNVGRNIRAFNHQTSKGGNIMGINVAEMRKIAKGYGIKTAGRKEAEVLAEVLDAIEAEYGEEEAGKNFKAWKVENKDKIAFHKDHSKMEGGGTPPPEEEPEPEPEEDKDAKGKGAKGKSLAGAKAKAQEAKAKVAEKKAAAPAKKKGPVREGPTKKSIVIELVSRKSGATIEQMGEAITKAGLGDLEQNLKTAKLWLPKWGFVVTKDDKGRYFKAA